MANQRARTTIEVDIDDRNVRGLDKTVHRVFDDRMLKAFDEGLQRISRNLETMTKAAERFEQAMKRAAAGGGSSFGGGGSRIPSGGGGGGGGTDRALLAAISSLSQQISQLNQAGQQSRTKPGFMNRAGATAVGTYLGGLGRAAGSGDGFFSQAAGGIPVIGGFLQGALSQIRSHHQMYAQSEIARSRQLGALGRNGIAGGQQPFTGFGLSRPEAFAQASQFAQQAGLSGDQLTGEFYNTSLRLQNLGGIQGGGASVMRAMGVGRGPGAALGQNANQSMMAAVSAGIQSGIRESRLTQFIQAATSVLEQGRVEGALLELRNVMAMQAGFGSMGAGFQGEQATRATQSSIAAMRGFAPGMDAASLIGLRAAGFGNGTDYHEALRKFQERPEEVMPGLIQTVRSMTRGNQGASIEMMRQIMPKFLGFTPTITQAESLLAGDTSVFTQGADGSHGEDFMNRREGLRGGFGVAAGEATHRNRQIRLGRDVAGAATAMRSAELSMLETIGPAVADGVEEIVGYLQGLYETFQTDGLSAVFNELFGDVFGGLGELISKGLEKAFENLGFEGLAEAARDLAEAARMLRENFSGSIRDAVTGLPDALDDTLDQATGSGRHNPLRQGVENENTRARVRRNWQENIDTNGEASDPNASAADALERARGNLDEVIGIMRRASGAREGTLAMG